MAPDPAPKAQTAPQPSWLRQKLSAWSVTSLIGAAALLIFIFQNTKHVTFHFLVFDFSWPVWLYTIVVAVAGAMVWVGLGVRRRHRRRKERREERD